MDQNIAALVPLLPGCFGWNLVRTKCLAGLIIALIKARTVNFMQLATALPDGTLKDSKYKHIQRLFRTLSSRLLHRGSVYCQSVARGSISTDPGSDQLEIRSNPYQYSVLGDRPTRCGDPRVIDPAR